MEGRGGIGEIMKGYEKIRTAKFKGRTKSAKSGMNTKPDGLWGWY